MGGGEIQEGEISIGEMLGGEMLRGKMLGWGISLSVNVAVCNPPQKPECK